jgi:hypothetical protein
VVTASVAVVATAVVVSGAVATAVVSGAVIAGAEEMTVADRVALRPKSASFAQLIRVRQSAFLNCC